MKKMIQIIKYDTNASTRNATTDDSEESVIDKLDKIQQDFKSDSIISFLNKAISKHITI